MLAKPKPNIKTKMRDYKVLIIDDEHFAKEGLKKIIERIFPNFFLSIDLASSVREGVEKIKIDNPDIVFLDVHMPDEYGFKLFDYFDEVSFEVIFTTAHSDYVLQAVNQWGCLGYLMKPIVIDELKTLIHRFENRRNNSLEIKDELVFKEDVEEGITNDNLKYCFKNDHGIILISTITEVFVIKIEEIVYCKADDSYCTIYTIEKAYVVTKTLKDVESLIDQANFFRINRSYLVNINFAKRIDKRNNILELDCVPETGEKNLPVTTLGYKNLSNVVS